MVRITDKSFKYTPSYDTDLGKKFRMIIGQQRKAELKRHKNVQATKSMVFPITCSVRNVVNGSV